MNENKTMKIRNITGWTHEVFNPAYVEFPPNLVVEVSYTLGSHLIRQPEFEEDKGEIKKGKKKTIKKEEKRENKYTDCTLSDEENWPCQWSGKTGCPIDCKRKVKREESE